VWWFAAAPLMQARAHLDRFFLAYSRTERLEQRVQVLTESRADVVDHSAAELRRLERDLHDGAQARLVALSMSLGMAQEALDDDPATARRLVEDARATTATAISDLRSVVRGIHPPVLADRGLAGAVQALALDMAVPVDVEVNLPGRPPAPVESALYFGVAECLANIGKHADARHAWVGLAHRDGRLRAVVGDDGRGGASPGAGTGMLGVMRRLAAFDGTMTLSSPEGGPTLVTLEVPCDLSSPKTTPSSGPA
jgi:signal transduction histidine kinase